MLCNHFLKKKSYSNSLSRGKLKTHFQSDMSVCYVHRNETFTRCDTNILTLCSTFRMFIMT